MKKNKFEHIDKKRKIHSSKVNKKMKEIKLELGLSSSEIEIKSARSNKRPSINAWIGDIK
jgi:hypothetical protein